MAVGETSGQAPGQPRRVVSSAGRPPVGRRAGEAAARCSRKPIRSWRSCSTKKKTIARRTHEGSRGAALPWGGLREDTIMLMPRKVAHRKHHRGRTRGMTKGGASLHFGEYGIQALEPGWLTARQIEAARIAMTRAHQARRQGLDQRLPGQAGHQEAGRDPHGFRQGQPRVLGRRRRARAGCCSSSPTPTRSWPGRRSTKADPEAADQGARHHARRGDLRRDRDGTHHRPATELE